VVKIADGKKCTFGPRAHKFTSTSATFSYVLDRGGGFFSTSD
jgi:hypothetical protein